MDGQHASVSRAPPSSGSRGSRNLTGQPCSEHDFWHFKGGEQYNVLQSTGLFYFRFIEHATTHWVRPSVVRKLSIPIFTQYTVTLSDVQDMTINSNLFEQLSSQQYGTYHNRRSIDPIRLTEMDETVRCRYPASSCVTLATPDNNEAKDSSWKEVKREISQISL